jgi:hypothetical protein
MQETGAAELTLAKMRAQARKGRSLQECCQRLMEDFHEAFTDSIVLARTYATVPFGLLPAPDRLFVENIVDRQGAGRLLNDDTRVLSLLGTCGVRPQWRNRYQSSGHLAIPLLSEEFVEGIPMLANLIQQLGSSRSWYQKYTGPSAQVNHFGVFTETFFVTDAAESVDSSGRLLIPAQDFVQEFNIQSVFGVGGEFMAEGIVVVTIFFSTEKLASTPKWLLRVPLLLATVTRSLVADGKLYAPDLNVPATT